MSFVDATSQIEEHFLGLWNETVVAKENVQFDPTNVEEYVRIYDSVASGNQASLGDNPLYRYRGIVVVQVFVKPNIGTARTKELVDFVTGIFRSVKVGKATFYTPYPVRVGDRDGWYQTNVICPYYRDEE